MTEILSDKHLQKYIQLCKEVLNEDVDKQEALRQSLKLLNLFEALLKNKNNSAKGKA